MIKPNSLKGAGTVFMLTSLFATWEGAEAQLQHYTPLADADASFLGEGENDWSPFITSAKKSVLTLSGYIKLRTL